MNSCYRLLLYNRTNVSKRLPNRGMEKEDVERRKRNEEEGRSPSPSGISGIQLLSCQSYVNPRCFFAALLIIDHLITIHYTLSPPFFFSSLWYTVERERRSVLFVHPRETESEQREGNFFFFAVAWPRDDHLHIGLPPSSTLIDKYTGGAPRNEGPPPLSLLLYFFQRGPPLSVNSFDVDQLLYLSLPSSRRYPLHLFHRPLCLSFTLRALRKATHSMLRLSLRVCVERYISGMGTHFGVGKEREKEEKKKKEKKNFCQTRVPIVTASRSK